MDRKVFLDLFIVPELTLGMRVGVLARGEGTELEWIHQLGFRSMEWVAFAESGCGPAVKDWKPYAERFAAEAKAKDIRISAIGALYANPLDPKQTAYAKDVFERAILVAAHIGVKTVAGFPGAVIQTELHPRGGNPVYHPFETFLPRFFDFWEPLARLAQERGVRIAFEHCPQGPFHLPIMHYNAFGQPAFWERFFNASRYSNLGLEWDPSHLVCQFIDPVQNIRQFGSRIFHVHAKDAFICRPLLEQYGICHPGVAEHRFPGLGQSNWPEIVHALLRVGYDSDLNIEGWHDPVYRDYARPSKHEAQSPPSILEGKNLETTGLMIAKRLLEPLTAWKEE